MHWPFCEAKCPYCDFNSHVAKFIDHARWRKAYLTEIERYASELPGRTVQSVFFGGGTPSLMDPNSVAEIVDQIARRWAIADDIEITLEANPGSVEAGRFASYRTAGVNRASIGVQALNDRDLARLGRLHSVAEAMDALDVAQRAFDRVSFDLIYARQDQTIDDWRSELLSAIDLGCSHLSLYQLTIEDGTPFGERRRRGGLRGLPSDDLAADMYDETFAICEAAGLPRYEVSNFAVPGQESRHNLIYWQYGDYLGIGPGAHGRIGESGNRRWATETPLNPGAWLEAVENGQRQESRTLLSIRAQTEEMLLMGLRLRVGVALERLNGMAYELLDHDQILDLRSMGILKDDEDRIIVENQYVNVLNAVIDRILLD